jgi:RNA polymerase sigma-54 factor
MRFDARLQQRLEQRMILAPRMIQAMEILQLPLMALQERIDQELIANPVLEIRDEEAEPRPPADENTESPTSPVAEAERDLVVRENAETEDFERLSNVVDRWENYFEEDSEGFRRSRVAAGDVDPKSEAMQNAPAAGVTLQEHMLGLWDAEGLGDRATALGQLIIRNLDDSGYLRVPLEELAAEAEPPVSVEEMLEVLEEVQRTGPLGVGARDLQECLLLQLQGPPGQDVRPLPEDSLEVRIIRNHLHDVEANRFPQIVQALETTIEEVKEVVDLIRHLNPRPGAVISPKKTPTIVPDVRIDWDDEADDFRITILRGGTPELYVSGAYRRLVKQEGLDPKTRQFVNQNIRSAQWLMEAIELRRDTLRRVTESILKFQRPFFDEGPAHLQPLKMQQVADDVHLHVSTISRAVADKYADTPWGIWPLRDFFIGGTQTAESGDVSWDQVRARLKVLVEAEDKKNPLSDEELVDRLRAEGIGKLARRTVAKYREELGIPSSRRRKEF